MRHVSLRVAVAAAVLTITAFGVPALTRAATPSAPPRLDGVWKLNEAQSESFQKKLAELRSSAGGAGEGRRGMGGGRGMRGGGMGGEGGGREGGWGGRGPGGGGPAGGADESSGARAPRSNLLARPPLMMALEQSDSAVVVTDRGDLVETLVLSAGAVAPADPPRYVAHWSGARLEAEGSGPRGGKLHQSFELSQDGKQLIVIARTEGAGGRPPLELKRVYDRYEGD